MTTGESQTLAVSWIAGGGYLGSEFPPSSRPFELAAAHRKKIGRAVRLASQMPRKGSPLSPRKKEFPVKSGLGQLLFFERTSDCESAAPSAPNLPSRLSDRDREPWRNWRIDWPLPLGQPRSARLCSVGPRVGSEDQLQTWIKCIFTEGQCQPLSISATPPILPTWRNSPGVLVAKRWITRATRPVHPV